MEIHESLRWRVSDNPLGEFIHSAELGQVVLRTCISTEDWHGARSTLDNLSVNFFGLNRLALSDRYSLLALRLAEALDSPADIFVARLSRFRYLAVTGRCDEAEEMWGLLDPMGRDWPLRLHRSGDAERTRLKFLLFPMGRLTKEDLAAAERLALSAENRRAIRGLHQLRGEWRLSRGDHAPAAESLQNAIRMAHEAGFGDPRSETLLALARFRLNQLPAPREEALRLSAGRDPAHLALAELWHALADTERAARQAQSRLPVRLGGRRAIRQKICP